MLLNILQCKEQPLQQRIHPAPNVILSLDKYLLSTVLDTVRVMETIY